jgi:spore coat polysaccharide biosynthesis protein SpsF
MYDITEIKRNKRVVATIEARMNSTRLPGKVLMPALGEPMLLHLVRRLRAVSLIDEVVIATTLSDADDAILQFSETESICCYRGSESDVLGRVIGAATSADAEIVVTITGDCPLIDPELVEQAIAVFLCHDVDFVTNAQIPTYPDGMDAQVMLLSLLKETAELTDDPRDREHVTRYICRNLESYSRVHVLAPLPLRRPELALTLDEFGDYNLLRSLIEEISPSNPLFSLSDILTCLGNHPEWLQFNKDVVRKTCQ